MRVICIDANIPNKDIPQLQDGKIYTVVGYSEIRIGNYFLAEIPDIASNGLRCSYHSKRFIPLSTIDETELIEQRELVII